MAQEMTDAGLFRAGSVEWAVAGHALGGADESGDCHVVAEHPSGVLLGVADGLGHGPEAAVAGRAAVEALMRHVDQSVIVLMSLCHESLRKTRGAALSIASLNIAAGSLEWVGVGNVEGILVRSASSRRMSKESLLLRGGVVGDRMPKLRATTLPIYPGDTLIFATDGIGDGFATADPAGRPVDEFAREILRDYGKDIDDALVLVARYAPSSPL
jgi:negative regulator of sigma-B (phosphoserine phosphatase)